MAIPAITELAFLAEAVTMWPMTHTYQVRHECSSSEDSVTYKVPDDKKPTSTKQIRIGTTN